MVALFFGSGNLDTIVNYVEKVATGDLSLALFSAICFGVAGVIGVTILISRTLQNKVAFDKGAILGVFFWEFQISFPSIF